MQMSPEEEEEEEHRWTTGTGGPQGQGVQITETFDPQCPSPKHDALKEQFGNFRSPNARERTAISPVGAACGSTDRVWIQVLRQAASCR